VVGVSRSSARAATGGLYEREEEEEPTAAEVAREEGQPPRLGVALAAVGAFVSVVTTGTVLLALPAGLLGLVAVVGGALRRSTRLVTFGFVSLFTGVVLAGLAGAGPEALLLAVAGAFVAWDAATQAIDLGGALKSRAGAATRPLLVHVSTSAGVSALAAGVGYVAFRLTAGTRPVAALVFMLLGGLLILTALRV
jgi:hypothetical protein